MSTSKNTDFAKRAAQRVLAEAGTTLDNPYEPGALSKAGKFIGAALGGGGGDFERENEYSYQLQRAGEREDYTDYLKKSQMPGGSKTFTKAEVRQGYRKLGKA